MNHRLCPMKREKKAHQSCKDPLYTSVNQKELLFQDFVNPSGRLVDIDEEIN